MKERKILVWFRNDLRMHDQEALYKAASKAAQVIPVYCFDPRQFSRNALGFPKTGALRAQFLIESVEDLRLSLQRLGSDLIVRMGKPEEVIPTLAEMAGVSAVYAGREIMEEETDVENHLEARLWAKKIPLALFWQSTLFHIDDIPFPIRNFPDSYPDFRKEADKSTRVRPPFPVPAQLQADKSISPGKIPTLTELGLPDLPKPDPRAAMVFKGGETQGLQRLQTYFWEEDRLREYKDTRNGMMGAGYSTKLSCWLALGCISPRHIYQEVQRYESERVKNDSTAELVTELLWRDFFRFIARKYGNRIFRTEGIRKDQQLAYSENISLFRKWVEGETGVPFVDAHMRELKQTGYLSNRGRQVVAHFLARDLKINWTFGALYFDSQQLDNDPSLNWCNWNYLLGLSNDPRENRSFNLMAQAKKYDPQGEYVKLWLPELASIPASRIHQAGELSAEEQQQCGVVIGRDYPPPVIAYEKGMA
jgi:deoxyribodipyrimidine photo-lyase